MTTPVIPLLGGAVLLAAACALPGAARIGSSDRLTCALEVEQHAGMLAVRAVVEARRPVAGRFDLQLKKQDRDGTADLGQSGAFSLKAGERAVLNDVAISGRARDLRAGFTVTTPEGVLRCPVLVDGVAREET